MPLLASSATTGNRFIDFAWANAQIDKDSIQFRPLAVRQGGDFHPIRHVGGKPAVAVLNVAYPPNENALVWEVYAREACALRVRVSYLISNLTRTFAYRALADEGETHHPQGHVIGWTEETDWTDEIRNDRTKPIRFELRRQWPGHVEYESELPTTLFDYRTIETMLDVGPRDRAHYPATVVTHRGANGGQERIGLR